MKLRIEVKTDLSDSERYFSNMLTSLNTLEELFSRVDESLQDTDKWAGQAHDTCIQIQSYIKEYEKSIRSVCTDLGNCVNLLVQSAGDFETNSVCVRKLKNW